MTLSFRNILPWIHIRFEGPGMWNVVRFDGDTETLLGRYRTWRALLYYLETEYVQICSADAPDNTITLRWRSCVYFAPLRSSLECAFKPMGLKPTRQARRKYAHQARTSVRPVLGFDMPYECSPKSLYTLADSRKCTYKRILLDSLIALTA